MAETNAYPELARDLRFFPVQNDAEGAEIVISLGGGLGGVRGLQKSLST